MLHQIKLPTYNNALSDFLQFQKRLLHFACTPALSQPLELSTVQKVFSGEEGKWICDKLGIRGTTTTKFYDYLKALIKYVGDHPTEGPEIIAAFEHDVDFYYHFDDPGFKFHYESLKADAQKVVEPLMNACYTLLYDGFPRSGYYPLQKFSRYDMVVAFKEENKHILKVCPACDGKYPTITRDRNYSQVDHFFPKSRYPFLSIHPYNLVPICEMCNTSFKRDIDPLEQNELLVDTFHPYGRPAICSIDVQISEGREGKCEVHIHDLTHRLAGESSKLLKNLERLLRLQIRWEDDYLPGVIGDILEHLRSTGNYRKDSSLSVDETIVEDTLKIILQNYEQNVGRQKYYVVKSAYACYALTHKNEFNRLVQELMSVS